MTFLRCFGEFDACYQPRAEDGNRQPRTMHALFPWAKNRDHGSRTRMMYRKGERSSANFHQQYAITRHLGEGSYSTVKQVTHRKKGGAFACKIVDKKNLSTSDRLALSHEVQVLASVDHDHIMKLHEVIEDDTKCYLIIELAENGDLFDRIVNKGKFSPQDAQRITSVLVEALHHCHSKKIMHRDVKPENVLLSGDDVKLCDFGFAKQLKQFDEQSTESCGTPGYAAPEILDGKPYGLEVDIFSLGVVVYIMLCGYPPFPMKLSQLRNHRFNVRFPSKDWSHIDTSVKALITRMLHVTPEKRPSTSDLRLHPWVFEGRTMNELMKREAREKKRRDDLARKEALADELHKKLLHHGVEVTKYGRHGPPHRTKLRLSPNENALTWQPKLFKRGLLHYHHLRALGGFFRSHSSGNQSDSATCSSSSSSASSRGSQRLSGVVFGEDFPFKERSESDYEKRRESTATTTRGSTCSVYEERKSEPIIFSCSSNVYDAPHTNTSDNKRSSNTSDKASQRGSASKHGGNGLFWWRNSFKRDRDHGSDPDSKVESPSCSSCRDSTCSTISSLSSTMSSVTSSTVGSNRASVTSLEDEASGLSCSMSLGMIRCMQRMDLHQYRQCRKQKVTFPASTSRGRSFSSCSSASSEPNDDNVTQQHSSEDDSDDSCSSGSTQRNCTSTGLILKTVDRDLQIEFENAETCEAMVLLLERLGVCSLVVCGTPSFDKSNTTTSSNQAELSTSE